MKRKLFISGLACLLSSLPAWPQAAAGLAEISGTVHDSSGAVVPDAQVVIVNPSKGVHLTLTT